jgi:hypothetical protein
VSSGFTAVALYLGMTKGTGKTVDIALDKLEKRMKESPTAKRLLKLMEVSDKIFGDEQAVEQMTKFFKEARELVSSPEAKNFFKNVTELMKSLSEESDVKLKLPEKEVTS